jgi:hypothetical protein
VINVANGSRLSLRCSGHALPHISEGAEAGIEAIDVKRQWPADA